MSEEQKSMNELLGAKARHQSALDAFWSAAERSAESKVSDGVDDLGDGWYMCQGCAEAVEASGVAQCPACSKVLVVTSTVWRSLDGELLHTPGGEPEIQFVISGDTFAKTSGGWKRGNTKASVDDVINALRGDAGAPFDVSAIFDAYPLTLEDGYFENDDFEGWVKSADSKSLVSVCGVIRDGFTFVPGGDWTPSWMPGERRGGSPLALLEPVLERLATLDSAAHIAVCAELLRYIACDEDVFAHDALAMSQNMADEITDSLVNADLANVDPQHLVSSVRQLCESAAGFEYGVNALPLAVKCLEMLGDAALVEAIDVFAGNQARELLDDNPFDSYVEIMTKDDIDEFVEKADALLSAHPGLEAALTNARQYLKK